MAHMSIDPVSGQLFSQEPQRLLLMTPAKQCIAISVSVPIATRCQLEVCLLSPCVSFAIQSQTPSPTTETKSILMSH